MPRTDAVHPEGTARLSRTTDCKTSSLRMALPFFSRGCFLRARECNRKRENPALLKMHSQNGILPQAMRSGRKGGGAWCFDFALHRSKPSRASLERERKKDTPVNSGKRDYRLPKIVRYLRQVLLRFLFFCFLFVKHAPGNHEQVHSPPRDRKKRRNVFLFWTN